MPAKARSVRDPARRSVRPAAADAAVSAPFWRRKTLAQMTAAEWESLCDGCGRCCLNKLEDEDTGDAVTTCVCCRLLDEESWRCSDYPNRSERVRECMQLTPERVGTLTWRPTAWGYRVGGEGAGLWCGQVRAGVAGGRGAGGRGGARRRWRCRSAGGR